MINLAPVKFANCHSELGGPIDSIVTSQIEIYCEHYTMVNSCLTRDHREHTHRGSMFAEVDGSGVDTSPTTARFKSLSESVERWAFSDLLNTDSASAYGLDVNPTTMGIAAFPGLFPKQARAHALREAIERYAIIAWWDGLLPIKKHEIADDGHEIYEITHPFDEHSAVITANQFAKSKWAFGFGCGKDLQSAIEGSKLEMGRSELVLKLFFEKNPGFRFDDLATLKNFYEKRVMYFCLPEGREAFEEKVRESPEKLEVGLPETLFDGEIKGPWSKYATVWRVLHKTPSNDFLDGKKLTFFW